MLGLHLQFVVIATLYIQLNVKRFSPTCVLFRPMAKRINVGVESWSP